jgi:hypothetical protein
MFLLPLGWALLAARLDNICRFSREVCLTGKRAVGQMKVSPAAVTGNTSTLAAAS